MVVNHILFIRNNRVSIEPANEMLLMWRQEHFRCESSDAQLFDNVKQVNLRKELVSSIHEKSIASRNTTLVTAHTIAAAAPFVSQSVEFLPVVRECLLFLEIGHKYTCTGFVGLSFRVFGLLIE